MRRLRAAIVVRGETFADAMQEEQEELLRILENNGVDARRARDARDSGYYAMEYQSALAPHAPPQLIVRDSFYGNKQFSGHFQVEQFVELLSGGMHPFPAHRQRYTVHSLAEA